MGGAVGAVGQSISQAPTSTGQGPSGLFGNTPTPGIGMGGGALPAGTPRIGGNGEGLPMAAGFGGGSMTPMATPQPAPQQAPQQMAMSPLMQQQMAQQQQQQQPNFGGQMGGVRPMGAPSGVNPFSQERMATLRQDPQFLEMQRVSGGGYGPQGGAVDGLGNPIKQFQPQFRPQQQFQQQGIQQLLNSMMNRFQPQMQQRQMPMPMQALQQQSRALQYRPNMAQAQQSLSRVKPSVYKTDLDTARARIAELEAAQQPQNSGYYSGGG